MAFSIFKKDPKDQKGAKAAKEPTGPETRLTLFGATLIGRKPTPAGPNARAAERKARPAEAARALARQTAEKIDQIESEMAHTLSGPTAQPPAPATRAGPATAAIRGVPTRPDEFLGVSTDAFLGQARAIETTQLGAGPAIDDAAMAYADGDEQEAENLLRLAIADNTLGESERAAWRLLFELQMLRDDRAEFEAMARRYTMRFGEAPPAWHAYGGATAVPVAHAAEPVDEGPLVRLPADLDAGVVEPLRSLKTKASQYRHLALDLSSARSIDFAGADLLLRVLAAFRASAHQLTLFGIERLLSVTRHAAVPGRRDDSDAIWNLLLEAVRLTGNQVIFEDVAMQYCITYEVSPPAWEAPAPNIMLGAAPPPRPQAAAPAPRVPAQDDGRLHWRDEILGDGGAALAALLERAATQKSVVVDCADLRRIGSNAASALLAQAIKLQMRGTAVVLQDVNPWVGALLNSVGVATIVEVQPRQG